jgi:hypothetical protein
MSYAIAGSGQRRPSEGRQPSTAQIRLPEVTCKFLPEGATDPIFRPAQDFPRSGQPHHHSSSGKAKKDLRGLVGQARVRKRVGVDGAERQWTGNTELVRIQSEKTDQKIV